MITAVLVYLLIGSLVWLALYCAGIIQGAYRNRPDRKVAVTLASLGVVLGWPLFAAMFLGMGWLR